MGSRSLKCCILFMAVIILIQGCVYLGLSLWGFTLTKCDGPISVNSTDPVKLIVELIYFKTEDCFPLVVQTNLTNLTDVAIPLDISWEISDQITNRTIIILISYAVVSSLWILTSLLVICSICAPINKLVAWWPWFLAVLAGIVLDVVATVYHSIDLIHTMNAEEALNYIGFVDDKSKELLQSVGMLFVVPAFIFTCLSSRFVLLWLFNAIGFCICISLYRKATPPKLRNVSDGQTSSGDRANRTQAAQASGKNDKLQQVREAKQSKNKIGQNQNADTADDVIATVSKTVTNESHTSQNPTNQDNWKQYTAAKPYHLPSNASSNLIQSLRVNNTQDNSQPAADAIHTDTSSQLRRTPSMLNDKNNSSSDMVRVRSVHVHKNEAMGHTNMSTNVLPSTRYITPHDYNPPQMSNARLNELRGQLPWSYTNMPNEASRVNVYPEIPTTDY